MTIEPCPITSVLSCRHSSLAAVSTPLLLGGAGVTPVMPHRITRVPAHHALLWGVGHSGHATHLASHAPSPRSAATALPAPYPSPCSLPILRAQHPRCPAAVPLLPNLARVPPNLGGVEHAGLLSPTWPQAFSPSPHSPPYLPSLPRLPHPLSPLSPFSPLSPLSPFSPLSPLPPIFPRSPISHLSPPSPRAQGAGELVGADELVVGLPVSWDRSEGPQAATCRQFAQSLAKPAAVEGVRVFLHDEYSTSQDALDLMIQS
ncbi:unnamed protein product [Closterium sp. NIES-64]|nr:unnamed protein product [Closterium sp. NIES-64]